MIALMQSQILYSVDKTHTPTDATLIVGILANSRSVHVGRLLYEVRVRIVIERYYAPIIQTFKPRSRVAQPPKRQPAILRNI